MSNNNLLGMLTNSNKDIRQISIIVVVITFIIAIILVIWNLFGEVPYKTISIERIANSNEIRSRFMLTVELEDKNSDNYFKSVYAKMDKEKKISKYVRNTTKNSDDVYLITPEGKYHVDVADETYTKISEATFDKNSIFNDIVDLVSKKSGWGGYDFATKGNYCKFENDKFGKTKIIELELERKYKVESEKLGNLIVEVKTEAKEDLFKINTNKLTEIQER